MYHLILAIFDVYREWVNLAIVSDWLLFLWLFLLCRQRYIVISLLTNILIVSRIGQKRLLNALNVIVDASHVWEFSSYWIKKKDVPNQILFIWKKMYGSTVITTSRHAYVCSPHTCKLIFVLAMHVKRPQSFTMPWDSMLHLFCDD